MYAQSRDDLISESDLLDLSGLEFMEAMRAGTLPHPPISRVLGYRLDSVDPGVVTFRGTPAFDALNPMGATHGGWYGTILDSCMACAVMTTVPRGSVYTTLEYKVNIVRPVPTGTEVLATGTIQHAGRSTGVANGVIRGADDDRLYATGSTTCIIMARR